MRMLAEMVLSNAVIATVIARRRGSRRPLLSPAAGYSRAVVLGPLKVGNATALSSAGQFFAE